MNVCFMWAMLTVRAPLPRTEFSVGKSSAIKIPIMLMTTKISIMVNALRIWLVARRAPNTGDVRIKFIGFPSETRRFSIRNDCVNGCGLFYRTQLQHIVSNTMDSTCSDNRGP